MGEYENNIKSATTDLNAIISSSTSNKVSQNGQY